MLAADENLIAQRKNHIRRFGYTWLRPAGVAKTMQGMEEERLEREEMEEMERRDSERLNAMAMGEMGMAVEGGIAPEAPEDEQDLDAMVPDADAQEDEEEEEEGGAGPEWESEGQEETEAYEVEDEAIEEGGLDDADLDDEIPNADEGDDGSGEWQHTDTDEDDSSDEDEDESAFGSPVDQSSVHHGEYTQAYARRHHPGGTRTRPNHNPRFFIYSPPGGGISIPESGMRSLHGTTARRPISGRHSSLIGGNQFHARQRSTSQRQASRHHPYRPAPLEQGHSPRSVSLGDSVMHRPPGRRQASGTMMISSGDLTLVEALAGTASVQQLGRDTLLTEQRGEMTVLPHRPRVQDVAPLSPSSTTHSNTTRERSRERRVENR